MRRSRTMKLASNEEFARQCFSILDQDQVLHLSIIYV
jgi:hypothetical protein